ncbi:hypothetical protein Z949_1911 [Sulfitobacter guttiformis KCTC 32187]|nr:hypothetical protein Z949_1911 [Sulfitobacter guttiformis KCTC 32187]
MQSLQLDPPARSADDGNALLLRLLSRLCERASIGMKIKVTGNFG